MAGPIKTEEEDIVLGQLIQVVIDDIWWLLAIAAVIIALAAAYCYLAKPVYSADAHVRVEQSDNTRPAPRSRPVRRRCRPTPRSKSSRAGAWWARWSSS
jgi:uncharacterized protein involved in exopolysaccharide biosynthesis